MQEYLKNITTGRQAEKLLTRGIGLLGCRKIKKECMLFAVLAQI